MGRAINIALGYARHNFPPGLERLRRCRSPNSETYTCCSSSTTGLSSPRPLMSVCRSIYRSDSDWGNSSTFVWGAGGCYLSYCDCLGTFTYTLAYRLSIILKIPSFFPFPSQGRLVKAIWVFQFLKIDGIGRNSTRFEYFFFLLILTFSEISIWK